MPDPSSAAEPDGAALMSDERLLRVMASLSADGADITPARLCDVCAAVTSTSGAGIALMFDGEPIATVASSDAVSATIERLQYTLGEGPCVDACRDGRRVAEPDLMSGGPGRWNAFAPAALDAGARAVFGFPMGVRGVRLGALNLYRDRPGPMTEDQVADASTFADVAARMIVSQHAESSAERLAGLDTAEADFRWVIHQAAGMVAMQLRVRVDDALVTLRAHAFSHDRNVTEVAEDVVARRLRFSDLDSSPDGGPRS